MEAGAGSGDGKPWIWLEGGWELLSSRISGFKRIGGAGEAGELRRSPRQWNIPRGSAYVLPG